MDYSRTSCRKKAGLVGTRLPHVLSSGIHLESGESAIARLSTQAPAAGRALADARMMHLHTLGQLLERVDRIRIETVTR